MQTLFWICVGFGAAFVLNFVRLWAKKGWGWGVAKLKAWWSKGKADIADAVAETKSAVTKVQTDVAGLRADVDALKAKYPL